MVCATIKRPGTKISDALHLITRILKGQIIYQSVLTIILCAIIKTASAQRCDIAVEIINIACIIYPPPLPLAENHQFALLCEVGFVIFLEEEIVIGEAG